ncbi:hypothetical protein JQ615_25270 [Bradyrhizobium jicamae]|uniref:Uncharacterized protein n=1 Tax=Bradyrhizobium jicamae TaxID=280332 RepID=A0ABS5FPL7_9BRAD|nr:hypothetical protein [Bradyrhizobium jicamae]MBR0798704.1 hypothetical protein [Bradyrhizobium jicamae]MBR0934029.1 hypothetical protein [Bradyrhizobium jicamae]
MPKKKRNRSRPAGSFEDRLQKFADDARSAARKMPPGRDREALMKKARQTEAVMEVSEMLTRRRIDAPLGADRESCDDRGEV